MHVFLACLTAILALFCGCATLPTDEITSRQAFRKDVEKHPGNIRNYLSSEDAEIRRHALYLLAKKEGAAAKDELISFTRDSEPLVRLTALSALLHYCGNEESVQRLLQDIAAGDPSQQVAKMASDASWPFHRDVLLLRNDPSWDHEVNVIHKFQIPDDKWLFHLDPMGNGHTSKLHWYQGKIAETDWKPIRMGEWELQGYDYDGLAWYRIRFQMPEKMECNAVELAFSAVDESAWVWLNGEYLGAHDLGPGGWNVPFSLDCRKEIRWGQENILVVRVLDTAADGGIFKPVHIEVLR